MKCVDCGYKFPDIVSAVPKTWKLFCQKCPSIYKWSNVCDNPNSQVIVDLKTKNTYTNEEAKRQSKEVKSRLVNHCTEKGYWVKI